MWLNPNDALGDGIDNDNDSLWYGSPLVDDFAGWDFRSNDNQPLPDTLCTPSCGAKGHGTAVAGIAVATCDNEIGLAGTWGSRGAGGPKFITIRLHAQAGSTVADAIEYAWRKGATVVNMSFGIYNNSATAVPAQLDSAFAHGTIVVAAAGNDGWYGYPQSHVKFPALYPSVIGVGAVRETDLLWTFSCKGPELDIVAPSGGTDPGVHTDLWTTDNDSLPGGYNPQLCPGGCPPGDYKYYSGFGATSAASPQVAGVAALLKSHMPSLNPAQVRQRLIDSAVDLGDVGPDSLYGYGRLDAYRALTEWGTISGHVVWRPEDTAGSTRYVSGDLTIGAGDTLTIMPGTIIRIASDDDLHAGADSLRIEINVEGTLIANGTSANPIVFEPWHPTTTEDWVGIYFDSLSGGGTFDHCQIRNAEYAIESYVPLTLEHSQIETCRYFGVLSQDGGGLIKDCTLSSPGSYGIYLATGANSTTVRNTTVDGAVGTALHLQPGETVIVRNSTFMNSTTGLYAGSAGSVDVDTTCFFYGNDTGIHFYNNTGVTLSVENSVLGENSSGAIVCDNGSSPLISANIIGFNGSGIYCTNYSSPVIQGNSIQASGQAITAASSSNPDVGHASPSGGQSPGNNSIAHTGKYVVNNNSSGTIYAENNCWNKNTGSCLPASNMFTGSVDRDPSQCCEFERWDDESMVEPQTYVFHMPGPSASSKLQPTALVAIVPNPFNPTATIHYNLSAPGRVDIKVYDVAGRLVQELVNGTQFPGPQSVVWTGTDRRGSQVASGVYFVRMVVGGKAFTKKMVMLK